MPLLMPKSYYKPRSNTVFFNVVNWKNWNILEQNQYGHIIIIIIIIIIINNNNIIILRIFYLTTHTTKDCYVYAGYVWLI